MESENKRFLDFQGQSFANTESNFPAFAIGQALGQLGQDTRPSSASNSQGDSLQQAVICAASSFQPRITDKLKQAEYNEENIQQCNQNVQDWYINTGISAVLITFIQGHIKIVAPDHMSSLKRNQIFKEIFLKTLFQNVPGKRGEHETENSTDMSKETTLLDTKFSTQFEKCDETFEKDDHLKEHKLMTHNMSQIEDNKDSSLLPNQCSKCGKAFQSAAFLQSHQCNRCPSTKRDHVCKTCGSRYTTESSLKVHSRTHSAEKPFKCSTCGECFARRSSLNYHVVKHTGERQYKCKTCGKEFVLLNNLRDHERIHSGERPFACHECGKAFTVLSTLRRHLLIHSGEKPFKCDKCDSSFTRLVHLQSHDRIHSGERPFKCKQCEKSFSQSSHLKRHEKIHEREQRARVAEKLEIGTRPTPSNENSGQATAVQRVCIQQDLTQTQQQQNFRIQSNFQFCNFDKQFSNI
eukprot:gene8098-8966_t